MSREFFPIKRRIVDYRLEPYVREKVEFTSRSRQSTETFMDTGATRQSQPPEWSRLSRPTHFLSLRIPPKCQFQSTYAEILHEVAFASETYSQLFVQAPRLHVTAAVFTLANDEQLTTTIDAAQNAAKELSRLQLRFEGVGTFSNGRVLFAKVVADHHHYKLTTYVDKVRQVCAANSIDTKGNPRDAYVPHVTIAKVRPQQTQQFPTRVIPPLVWAPFKHDSFGTVSFDKLDVCSMTGDGGADGYYKVVASIPIHP